MTLADEDSNSIQTDDANRTIQGNVAMQVAPSDVQTLVPLILADNTNRATNESSAIWWPNLQPM